MMLPAFRYLLGGSIGSGSQWMSWIHQEDLFNIFSLLLSDRKISGPVNCVSPNPVRNAEFAKTLARTLGRPLVFRRYLPFCCAPCWANSQTSS